MAFYLWTANYTRDAMQAMIENPQDREATARRVCEAAGGRLHHMFFTLGSSDVVVLAEFPDDASIAAVSLVTGASGSVTNAATTRLLTPAEFSEAMRKAGTVAGAYAPPQR